MEVFFKNLTSDETPTERLVEDVMMLVSETEELVNRTHQSLSPEAQGELKTGLERVKQKCQQLKQQAFSGAAQTDAFIRKNPYPTMLGCIGVGVVIGLLLNRRSAD